MTLPSAWRGLNSPLCASLIAALGLVSAALPALAQSLKGGRTAEIVVHASSGPALWRVYKGQSELVILGSVEPTPEGRIWNAIRVNEALQGARALLLSPGSTPGFAWADSFPGWERYLLQEPDGRTLSRELAAVPLGRLSQAATQSGTSVARYDTYRPGPAGMILLQDSWKARQLTGSAVDSVVMALAKALHVRIVKVDEGGSLPLIDAMPDMSRAQHLACVEESLERLDWEGANVETVYRDWEDGRVGALRQTYKPLQLCSDSIPGGARRRAQAKAIWIKALEGALNVRGRTVALMGISDLLGPGDILAALAAYGATVTAPPEEPVLPSTAQTAQVDLTDRSLTPYTPAPGDLQLAGSAPLLNYSLDRETIAFSAQAVDLAGRDVTCVDSSVTGSLIAKQTCHSAADWKQHELFNDPHMIGDLKHNKAQLPDSY